ARRDSEATGSIAVFRQTSHMSRDSRSGNGLVPGFSQRWQRMSGEDAASLMLRQFATTAKIYSETACTFLIMIVGGL
ncbi:MAG: hypothetical protein ACE5IO_06945, partial [Thermoplasmata archaeon]